MAYNSKRSRCENCIATVNNMMPDRYELMETDGTPQGIFFDDGEFQQPQ
ncbi:MAG: hypothetical protein H6765_08865 [Candidatus Peribacteria bacterium]|nr:MAG: hypothetical protein H6765_08865 [Candidatus Peribacteria bacterium]